jgi:hypothetical protein
MDNLDYGLAFWGKVPKPKDACTFLYNCKENMKGPDPAICLPKNLMKVYVPCFICENPKTSEAINKIWKEGEENKDF